MADTLKDPEAQASAAEPQAMAPEVRMRLQQIDEASRKLLRSVSNIAAITPVEGLDSSLEKRAADYSSRRAQLVASAKELFNPLLVSLERAYRGEGEVGNVYAAANVCRDGKVEILEQAHKLCLDGEQLAKDIVAQQEPLAAKTEQERLDTYEAVKNDLTKIGQGIESTVAGASGYNNKAAQDQFNFLARQNLRYRAAEAKAMGFKNQVKRHLDLSHAAAHRAKELRERITAAAIAEVKV